MLVGDLALQSYASIKRSPLGHHHQAVRSSLVLPLATRFASLTDVRNLGIISAPKLNMWEVEQVLQEIKEAKQRTEKKGKSQSIQPSHSSDSHLEKYTASGLGVSERESHHYDWSHHSKEDDHNKTGWVAPVSTSELTGTHPIAINSSPSFANEYIERSKNLYGAGSNASGPLKMTTLTHYGSTGENYKPSERVGVVSGDIWTTEYALKPATEKLKSSILGTATVRPQVYVVDGGYSYEQRNVLFTKKTKEKRETQTPMEPIKVEQTSQAIKVEEVKKEEVPASYDLKGFTLGSYEFKVAVPKVELDVQTNLDYSSSKAKEEEVKSNDQYYSGSVEFPSVSSYGLEATNSFNYWSQKTEEKPDSSERKELFFQPNSTVSYEIVKIEKKGEEVKRYSTTAKQIYSESTQAFVPEALFTPVDGEEHPAKDILAKGTLISFGSYEETENRSRLFRVQRNFK